MPTLDFLNMKTKLHTKLSRTNSRPFYYKHVKTICCFLVLFFLNVASYGFEQEKKNVTPIDIKNTTINNETEIKLDTNWEFYWNELIAPNNFTKHKSFALVSLNNWTQFKLSNSNKLPSFGYATYRKKISITKERPHVSLYIPAAYSSSKLWINGEFISEIGHVSKLKSTTQHRRFSQIIPLNTNETDFEIVIQVSNFYHNKGGINEPLLLGTSYHLYNIKSKRIIADMIFIGCIGFIGVFFLFFFIFYWNKDQAVLYFATLCISLSYMALSDRYAPLTEIFPSVNWIILTKIEYLSLFISGVSASLFFKNIFTNFIHKNYTKIIIYSFSLLGLLDIFLPPPYFTKLLLPFLICMVINFSYITFVIIKAVLVKRYESLLLLVSMLLGSIIFYVHIFFFLEKNGYAIIYVNFGYVLVFLLLSMLLMTRFSNSFKELENSKELALRQKKEISIKSNQLSSVNLELEGNLKLLENYNTELDDFNHIVSHDLKSPLVAVHALASFIEEDLKATLDNETKNHLKLLKNVVSKMDALINGLLKYSKIARGNKNKELFSLNELLKDVINIVDHQNKSTINVPKEDLEIYANKIELEHAFQNLISNSIKHNDKERAVIDILVSKKSKEYLFSVKDNGPGIDEKYHHKIFKMFSQLDINENDVESTGIGLAIVKKIIAENHGVISLESEEKKGIKISFTWKI